MCDWMDGWMDISQTTIAARALLRMSGANKSLWEIIISKILTLL